MFEILKYFYNVNILLIFLGIYLFYKLGKLKHNLHLKLGHEGPPPLPYLGNLIDISKKGLHEFDRHCLRKYGKIYPVYQGGLKMNVVADEDIVKQILVKDFKNFTDRMDFGLKTKNIEKMIIFLNGKDWERVRSLISPAFTPGKMRKMSPMFTEANELLKERMDKHPENVPIDFKEFFIALTMDTIARTMFGLEIDSQSNPNNKFLYYGKKISNIDVFSPTIMCLLLFPELKWLIKKVMFRWEFFGRETTQFFVDVLHKAISERQKSPEQFSDFLALMLKTHKEIDEKDPDQIRDSKSLTIEEIMAQSVSFLLGGFETTSITLTFVAYFLAMNPDAQQEVFEEILDKIGDNGEITYESLMNMPVLDAAVNETLRICPPIIRTDRQCVHDTTLVTSENEKIFAKKGDVFAIPIYGIQMDPSIWPDPEKFDLHRFDPHIKHSSYSFMPFGLGQRNCAGMRFALLETKWAIVTVLQKYELKPCPETPEKIVFKKTIFSTPTNPIILKIQKRK